MKLLAVDRFTGSAADLPSAVARQAFRRYRVDAPAGALEAFARHRVDQLLGAEGAEALAYADGQEIRGLAILQPLAWDSRVLGVPAGRLDIFVTGAYDDRVVIVSALLDGALAAAKSRGLRHLSLRVDASDDATVHVVERRGFINVDALLTFAASLDRIGTPHAVPGILVRSATAADAGALGELAAAAFKDGRFHTDPSIAPDTARGVYREWAIACATGAAADYVAVAMAGEHVGGFVACRLATDAAVHFGRPTSTIALIAAASDVRGQGVGPLLVGAARDWSRAHDVETLEVGTPVRNLTAARLYERCGFRLVASSFTFRMVIEA
jgi:ribosomal protein S18 acetylase RimI-like enzyme